MPIAQLGFEGRTPVFTWATKPPAAGNAGLEIVVQDLFNSKWKSDGSYWRPSNGSLAMNWDLSASVITSTSYVTVLDTGIDLSQFLTTPGSFIEIVTHAALNVAATGDNTISTYLGPTAGVNNVSIFTLNSASFTGCMSSYGKIAYAGSGKVQRSGYGFNRSGTTASPILEAISGVSGTTLKVGCKVGSASNTLTPVNLSMIISM